MVVVMMATALAQQPAPAFDAPFDPEQALDALQGGRTIEIPGAPPIVHAIDGDVLTTTMNGRSESMPIAPVAPCLAYAGGLPQLPYAVGQDLVWTGAPGYAVRHGDGIVACISAWVWTIRADGSCTSWAWSQTEDAADQWTPGDARCSVGEVVKVEDPNLPWPVVFAPLDDVWRVFPPAIQLGAVKPKKPKKLRRPPRSR